MFANGLISKWVFEEILNSSFGHADPYMRLHVLQYAFHSEPLFIYFHFQIMEISGNVHLLDGVFSTELPSYVKERKDKEVEHVISWQRVCVTSLLIL